MKEKRGAQTTKRNEVKLKSVFSVTDGWTKT